MVRTEPATVPSSSVSLPSRIVTVRPLSAKVVPRDAAGGIASLTRNSRAGPRLARSGVRRGRAWAVMAAGEEPGPEPAMVERRTDEARSAVLERRHGIVQVRDPARAGIGC